MMLPSIFGENLLDNWFDDGWNSWDYSNTSLMNTDIKENDNDYELTMNLPGVKKEDVTADIFAIFIFLIFVLIRCSMDC